MHAIQHRTQNYDTTDDASLSCINLTDSAAAACFRGFAVAGWARPVSDSAHLHAVQKLRGACDELIAKKETFEVIALSAVDATEMGSGGRNIARRRLRLCKGDRQGPDRQVPGRQGTRGNDRT